MKRPQPGWSEQAPHDWWQAVLSTVDQIAKSHSDHLARLRGIGLSGQMHGATLLDNALAQAVVEGVGYGLADCAEALRQTGSNPQQLIAIGGGARSDAWLQIIADVCEIELLRAANAQLGAAMGAARLAICACEGADPLQVCPIPEVESSFRPDPSQRQYHADGLARYRALYHQNAV